MAAFRGSGQVWLMISSGHSRFSADACSGPSARRDGAKPRFHGRRQGRPLRKGRARLIQTLLPTLSVTLPDTGALDLDQVFGRTTTEVWLEIGFGSGEHLAWQAAHYPSVSILGCEVFVNGVASLLRHVQDKELKNIRVFNQDAHHLLAALPDNSIRRLFLLHPDPWPKHRHIARRFVQEQSIRRLAQLMQKGGDLRVATDHPTYLSWTLRMMARQPWFDWTATTARDWLFRPDDWPQTRYGAKAEREGRRCTYLGYRRNRQPAG